MPFPRDTLSAIRQQVASDIDADLGGVDARLRFSNLAIIGEVQAALDHGLYGYLDWIARQSNPFTATDEFLEGWAALKGVTRKPATAAIGEASLPATNGKVLIEGSLITRGDGVSYLTTAEATASSGTVVAPIRAITTGSVGNALSGVSLFLGTAISGISAQGAAPGVITGGADVEIDDDLRSRMLAVYAAPAQGGSITDYSAWAVAVPGVTRAWIKPNAMGAGTVAILFMMDEAQAAHNGFPQGTNGVSQYETRDTAATGDQLAVADAIFPKKTVTALVYAISPTPNVVNFTIAGIGTPATGTQDAIDAAIDAALVSGAVPGGRTYLSAVNSAISLVAGTAGFVITSVSASAGTIEETPAGNILSNSGCLPVRGTVTYVA